MSSADDKGVWGRRGDIPRSFAELLHNLLKLKKLTARKYPQPQIKNPYFEAHIL